jgi:hypothetical protein
MKTSVIEVHEIRQVTAPLMKTTKRYCPVREMTAAWQCRRYGRALYRPISTKGNTSWNTT